MPRFVIHKSNRPPATRSFDGWQWKAAGVDADYRAQFDDRAMAQALADKVGKYTMSKLIVSEAPTK